MKTLFSWIHLSDIHAGHGSKAHQVNQELIFEHLISDISTLRDANRVERRVDALFVTGDIAFSGGKRDPKEYDVASAFIQKVAHAAGLTDGGRIARDHIYLIPGNHDVARGDPDFNSWFKKDRKAPNCLERLESSKSKEEKIEERFAAYKKFAGLYNPLYQGLDWMVGPLTRDGLDIFVYGWNTAWLSNDDEDRGLLRLRRRVRQDLQRKRGENQVVFLLSHHPLSESWLKDESELSKGIRGLVDIHLSGHVHVAETRQRQDGAHNNLVQVHAGAVHMDELKPIDNEGKPIPPSDWAVEHCYNFGRIVQAEDNTVQVIIQPRRWHASTNRFRWDVQGLPDHAFETSHTLSAKNATPHPLSPTKILLGHCKNEEIPYSALFDHVIGLKKSKRTIRVISLTGFSFCDDGRTGPLKRFFEAKGLLELALLNPSGKKFYAGYDLKPKNRRERIERVQRELTQFARDTGGRVKFLYLDEPLSYSSALFGDVGVFLPHPIDQHANHSDWMTAIIYKDDTADPLGSFLRKDRQALEARKAFQAISPR